MSFFSETNRRRDLRRADRSETQECQCALLFQTCFQLHYEDRTCHIDCFGETSCSARLSFSTTRLIKVFLSRSAQFAHLLTVFRLLSRYTFSITCCAHWRGQQMNSAVDLRQMDTAQMQLEVPADATQEYFCVSSEVRRRGFYGALGSRAGVRAMHIESRWVDHIAAVDRLAE